jgi:PAS domain-containing protein
MGRIIAFPTAPERFAVRPLTGGREALIRLTDRVPNGRLASVIYRGVPIIARLHCKNDLLCLEDRRGRRRTHHRSELLIEGEVIRVRPKTDALADALHTGQVVTWSHDPAGKTFRVAGHWADLYGITFGNLENYDWMKVLHPDDLTRHFEAVIRSLVTGEDLHAPCRMVCHGDYVPVIVHAHAVREGGRIVRWDGLCQSAIASLRASNSPQ